LSKENFKDETRMHTRTMKLLQNAHKCRHPITEKRKQWKRTLDQFLFWQSVSCNALVPRL